MSLNSFTAVSPFLWRPRCSELNMLGLLARLTWKRLCRLMLTPGTLPPSKQSSLTVKVEGRADTLTHSDSAYSLWSLSKHLSL